VGAERTVGLEDLTVPNFIIGRGIRDAGIDNVRVSSVDPRITGVDTGTASTPVGSSAAASAEELGMNMVRGATTVNVAVLDNALRDERLETLVCLVAEGRRQALDCGAGDEANDPAPVGAGDNAETDGDRGGGRRRRLGADLTALRVGVDAWVWWVGRPLS
jgi:hypothetical protein